MKKILALLLAVMMLFVGMSVAFADGDEGDGATDPAETQTPAATTDYDHPLTVTGLKTGDTIKFYKVIEWVGEAEGNVAGWKAISPYDTVLNAATLRTVIVGTPAQPAEGTAGEEGYVPAKPATPGTGITSAIAGRLADLATSGGVDATSINNGTATLNNPAPGMWMALVTPADAEWIYNPVFVSADYVKSAGGTVGIGDNYSGDGVVKSSKVTLTKEASVNEADWADKEWTTARIGEDISYTVKTQIPAYGEVYQSPEFWIKDTMNGLKLNADTVTISKPTGLTEGTDYVITEADAGYTIEFKAAYLKTLKAAQEVEVTYSAKVIKNSTLAIDWEKNEVSIEFSHNPQNESDKKLKKDTTQHYKFTIDGDIDGTGSYLKGKKHAEVVKVGVDANGLPITETVVKSDVTEANEWKSPLADAEFKLYTDSECKVEYQPLKADGTNDDKLVIKSTADGRMVIPNLDAGTYYLKETKAPAGYIMQTAAKKIEIIAHTTEKNITEYWNGSGWLTAAEYATLDADGKAACEACTYSTDILTSYDVKIDGETTSTYHFTNDGKSTDITFVDEGTIELPSPFTNTQGTQLPSTGGVGTTILYIGGSILVLAAVVLLVTKRRMKVED